MTRYKEINGVRIQFTAEEEAARDAEEAQVAIEKQAEIGARYVQHILEISEESHPD